MRSHTLKVTATIGVWVALAAVALHRASVVEKGDQWMGRKSVEDRVREFGPLVRARLAPCFDRAGVGYPPARVTLVGLKQERVLEVWVSARADGASPKLLKRYPILGASGRLGPKLREGDRQVPEGLYAIESLNPNSAYHLALRVNYPNPDDRSRAAAEGRHNPGGDIMIHGGALSIGCLAVGDEAAEELFVLAAETGIENMRVILSPVDFRVRALPADLEEMPPWMVGVYEEVGRALAVYSNQEI